MQSESTSPAGRCEDLCNTGRKRSIHFACQFGALRCGFKDVKKVPEFWHLQESALFSDLLNSTFKGSKWASKVPPLFPPRRCIDQCPLHVGQISPTQPSLILHKVVVTVGPISPTCSRMMLSKTAVKGRDIGLNTPESNIKLPDIGYRIKLFTDIRNQNFWMSVSVSCPCPLLCLMWNGHEHGHWHRHGDGH
jgi:hypothetical protein